MHGGTDGLKPLPSGLYVNGGGLVMPLSTSGKVLDQKTFPDLYANPGEYGLVQRGGGFYFVRS
jgi:hypothetical protein